MKAKIVVFWHRRDLRTHDNAGLSQALLSGLPVLPIFIFDKQILSEFKNPKDRRVNFIYQKVCELRSKYNSVGSDLKAFYGTTEEAFRVLLSKFEVVEVFTNEDYEPSAIDRDLFVKSFLKKSGVGFLQFKDQCIFAKNEILTDQKKPYSVFTPYKKKWLATIKPEQLKSFPSEDLLKFCYKTERFKIFPSLNEMGFEEVFFNYPIEEVSVSGLKVYDKTRDFPAYYNGTSLMGIHLRFGTVSIRDMVKVGFQNSSTWLSELIWREFFMQILWHFPWTEKKSFRPQFESLPWRFSESEFDLWKNGKTGYPIVDAGMRELKATGHMHNRVRMIVASFLTKHLFFHWSHGERFFAQHLLDYDLAANVGNWQWAAGSGCDAAPYFRIFNPTTQMEKFDENCEYIKKWVPEWEGFGYVLPMIDHKIARDRALNFYSQTFKSKS